MVAVQAIAEKCRKIKLMELSIWPKCGCCGCNGHCRSQFRTLFKGYVSSHDQMDF